MSHAILIFFVFLLFGGAVLCALIAMFYPRVSKEYPLNKRLEFIAPTGKNALTGRGNEGSAARSKDAQA